MKNMTKNLIRTVLFCTSLTLLLGSSIANAYNGEAFYYAKESISAFNTVKLGVQATNKTTQSDARTMLANNMKNLIRQRNAIKQAQAAFDGFKSSKDKTIQASEALISGSLGMLAINMDTMIDLIEKMLNMSDAEFIKNSGTFTKKTTEIGEDINKAWELYAKTSMSVTYALIDGAAADLKSADLSKKMTKLVITRNEVNELKKMLNEDFGAELKQKDSSKLAYYQMPPIFLMDFLNDKWKASNE